jgi:Protein of unknown function (DUF1360)
VAARETREIDWTSAKVRDGTLTVNMIGASSKAWRARFASVLALLNGPHTSWGLAQWVATALTLGLVGAPRLTRLLSSVFVAHTISDFLQVAYRAAEDL